MVKLMHKSSFLFLILISILALNVPKVYAEPTAKIYPTEGTVYTDIFLQVRGFGIGEEWDVHYKLYLFWDSEPIMTGVDDGGNHIYDIYFNPPNEHPYSDLGNHTVYVELWRSHYGWTFIANFTLIFEIIEWAPSPEYLALNATYSELLSNYTNLLDNYNSLVANYSTLNDDFTSLSANYDDLLDSYDGLNSTYNNLQRDYDSLSASYEGLNSTYYNLQRNYDSLSSSYDTLEASYSALIEEMSSARNLSYVFITTTIILAATAIYLAVRRTMVKQPALS